MTTMIPEKLVNRYIQLLSTKLKQVRTCFLQVLVSKYACHMCQTSSIWVCELARH